MASDNKSTTVLPWVRVVILIVACVVLGLVSWIFTGAVMPTDPDDALLLQSSLLLVVLGSLFLERYFTGPGDAFVNALTALITVLPLATSDEHAAWLLLVSYLAFVMLVALVALLLEGKDRPTGVGRAIGYRSYLVSSVLGRARVVFSVVFLVSIFFFVGTSSALAIPLIVFWGVYLALWPLGLPEALSRIFARAVRRRPRVGALTRIDSPNVARVKVDTGVPWPTESYPPLLANLPDGTSHWATPLMSESQGDGVWGTVLLGPSADVQPFGTNSSLERPITNDTLPTKAEIAFAIAGDADAEIVGIVREGSTSRRVRIELLPRIDITLGAVVAIPTAEGPIHYQIIEGETGEEQFGALHYGSHVATALPIGRYVDGRFERAAWLPHINAPAYRSKGITSDPERTDSFVLGEVPGAGVNFVESLESHTAILGTTGSGKTELAFDLIRHAASSGVKVICIDLTAQYAPRLRDVDPQSLSISAEKAQQLGDALFEVETGAYGAGDQKKVLKAFAAVLRQEVETNVREFLEGASQVALIELLEISNTKATLWITEMYLSTLLKFAKDRPTGSKILVVVEEAHTVMPEASFAGLGDFDSKGTIAKITQLALQGRKYGVGLLVLAQRTATVSKSVLTQCNTVISFACIDDTSIGFLRNVFGSTVAEGLPNLPRLRAVAHGAWINADLPVAFDVRFSTEKAQRSSWLAQSTAPNPSHAINNGPPF